MFEIIITVLSVFLFIKAVKLALKLTWGMTKIIATVLLVIAAPALILCLIFAGGLLILIPAVLLLGALGLLKFSHN